MRHQDRPGDGASPLTAAATEQPGRASDERLAAGDLKVSGGRGITAASGAAAVGGSRSAAAPPFTAPSAPEVVTSRPPINPVSRPVQTASPMPPLPPPTTTTPDSATPPPPELTPTPLPPAPVSSSTPASGTVGAVVDAGGGTSNRLHYLEALVAASNAINATLDPNKVADILASRVMELLEVAGVSVMLVDDRNEVRVVGSQGLSTAYIQAQAGPLERSIAGRALAEQRTFAAWDLQQSPDLHLAETARNEGIVSVACAPMYFNGRGVGALNVYCRQPRCFTDDQFHMLSLLAAQGAIALTNARAYRELRAQAAEVRAGFQRVGEALSASLDIGETLRLIVQLSVEMTRVDGGAMFMQLDQHEGGNLRLAGMRGLDRRSVRRFRQVPVSRLVARALEERRVVIVPDTRRVTDVAFPTLRLSVEETAEARSYVCIPILLGDRPLGVLEQYAAEPGRFTKGDIQLLSSFAHQASVAIENARLYAQERSIAQTLQRAFLPELPGNISGFQIGRIYAPGSEVSSVGGDTYDLFKLPDGRIAALIADVSGQGTFAATLAVMAKYTVRAYALEDPHPSAVLRRVNEALVPQTGDSTFLTLCYALLDPATRTVSLASAAHPPTVLCRVSDGKRSCTAVCPSPGLIAGFLRGQEYASETLSLSPGDILVFYTDGVIEARRHKVMFAQSRLEKVIMEHAHLTAQEIASAIYNAVTEFVEGTRPDDIALLVLKAE